MIITATCCRTFDFEFMVNDWSNEFTGEASCKESDALGDDKEVSDTGAIKEFVLDKYHVTSMSMSEYGESEVWGQSANPGSH